MRNLLLIVLVLIIFGISLSVNGQSRFDRNLDIPVTEGGNQLRFPWAGGLNFPWISEIDLNNDGLQDLFVLDHHNFRVLTFLNNGNPSADLAWDFAPQYMFSFPPVNRWAFLYDYNCDGKNDFFTLSTRSQCAGIVAYKNLGNNQWQIVDSCMQAWFVSAYQNIFTNSISLPNFNDIDGDGDMDILGYNTLPDGRIIYYKNVSMENFGTCDSLEYELSTVCWGNFQLKIGGNNTVGCFHCPCRMARPLHDSEMVSQIIPDPVIEFQEPSKDQSEAARRDDTISSIYTLDMDGDGFKELLVGDIASYNTLLIHNGGSEMDSQDTLFPSYDTPATFNGFHYHAYIDVDNDGKKDLLVMPNDHENKSGLWFYKNTGTTNSPTFFLASENFLQNNMIDVGEDACPVLFDYNNDNLQDIVISKAIFDFNTNGYKTGLYLYKNTGTSTTPAFEFVTDDFAGLTGPALYVSPTYPAFGDLDNDGDKDMLLGLEDGHIHFYENIALPNDPASFQGPLANYMGIDIGKYATPQLYDLNKDGLLDILIGGQRGFVNFFRNIGSVSAPMFSNIPTNDTLGCIVLQGIGTTDGFTVPFFYDSLGNTRLLLASENGNINQYDQIDGNLNGCFNLAGKIYNPVESSRIKFNITVSGGNLNGDTLTDIIIGQSTGGAEIRYQHDPFASIAEPGEINPSFTIYPNPASNYLKMNFYNLKNRSARIRIFNSLGEIVSVKSVSGEHSELNTSSLSAGIYFLQLTVGGYSVGRKFVVNHR